MFEDYNYASMIGALVLIAFIVSALLTRAFSHPSSRLHMLDHPNERSLHSTPVSRSGGLAICIAMLFGTPIPAFFFESDSSLSFMALGAVMVAVISFLDDRFTLSAGLRIIVHAGVAVMLMIGGYTLQVFELPVWQWQWPVIIGAVFSFLFIIWMLNLYNFMDGMDGFAGGMAVIGFSTFAILGSLADELLFATLSLVIVSAVLGFLIFNFPPAKIFMGDVGSSTLGFLVAAFSLWASRDGVFPLWIAVLVFSPFIVDATITLIRRLIKGEKIWEAHKTHYYQRLVQIGWGHRRTVLWEYLLMVLCGISAVVASKIEGAVQWMLLIIWIMIYSSLIFYINKLEYRHKNCGYTAAKS